jgi:hypothetical protein
MRALFNTAFVLVALATLGGCGTSLDIADSPENAKLEVTPCEKYSGCGDNSGSGDPGGSGMPDPSFRIVTSYVATEDASDGRSKLTLAATVQYTGREKSGPIVVVFKTADLRSNDGKVAPAIFVLRFEAGLRPGETVTKKGSTVVAGRPSYVWQLTPVQRINAK